MRNEDVGIQTELLLEELFSRGAAAWERSKANEDKLTLNLEEAREVEPQDFLILSHFSPNDLIMVNLILSPKRLDLLHRAAFLKHCTDKTLC